MSPSGIFAPCCSWPSLANAIIRLFPGHTEEEKRFVSVARRRKQVMGVLALRKVAALRLDEIEFEVKKKRPAVKNNGACNPWTDLLQK